MTKERSLLVAQRSTIKAPIYRVSEDIEGSAMRKRQSNIMNSISKTIIHTNNMELQIKCTGSANNKHKQQYKQPVP